MEDSQADISYASLSSLIHDIRKKTLFAAVSVLYGSIRSGGIKVTREQVQSLLRSVDPLGSALRSPSGPTSRWPYSVPGPNSLWHISI